MSLEEEEEFINQCVGVAKRELAPSPLPPRRSTAVASLGVSKDSVDILPGSNHSDFYGFPSNPISIYHTGPAWPKSTSPEAQWWRMPIEARPICVHPIAHVWPKLGREIYQYFDSIKLKWTSIDPVRFAEPNQEPGPLFLWVGVIPSSLSYNDAKAAAAHCKQILAQSQLPDVEIAFRESVVTRSVGPQLLRYVPTDPTANFCIPFTGALGVQIAPKAYSHFEGTGCLYLREGGKQDRVLLLTARHVVLPPSECANNAYTHKTTIWPRHDVILLGTKAYQNVLKAAMSKIGHDAVMVAIYKNQLESLGEEVTGEEDSEAIMDKREMYKHGSARADNSIKALTEFHKKLTRFWSIEEDRIIGHVLHAPEISIGTGDKCYTEDWALIELHNDKFTNWNDFKGNVMFLGTLQLLLPRSWSWLLSRYIGNNISAAEFTSKMHPHVQARSSFTYPRGGLMQLKDIVKESELRNPEMCDANGEPCLLVVKNGNKTGVTLGRATGIESFVREYLDNGICTTSMELAIHPFSHKDGAFSAPGDSGSVIADANGRIVGILTGGSGKNDSTDVTYATPYYWVDERIKMAFPNTYLFPIVA